jgi:glycosyltransferase involved in cell wall biosynthesis
MAIQKLPISVCIISGAEANRIGRALESVSAWAGEIIVLLNEDTNDGTEEIAKRHGAGVYREPWKGYISQKNSCTAKAVQPWLLNLDADEVVTERLAAELAGIVTAQQAAHAAYEFPRCTFYCGRWIRHGDWYPDRVLRLWRKGTARWGGDEPHAKLEVQGSIGRLRSDLLHFTNDSVEHHVSKIIRYTEDFARQAAHSGEAEPPQIRMLCRPVWKFFRAYFLRLGFLDGWQGCYIAWAGAFSVATKYARAGEAAIDSARK